MTDILVGFLFVILGACVLYFCNDLIETFGPLSVVEQYMNTRNFYLILGFVLVMVGVWYMFGVFGGGNGVVGPKTGFGSSVI